MRAIAGSRRIIKYIIICLLCLEFVFSATIEKVDSYEDDYGKLEDDHVDLADHYFELGEDYSEEENHLGEDNSGDKNLLHNDFFQFTTRKRYIWEDWTEPTRDYGEYGGRSSGSSEFVLYALVPAIIIGIIAVFAYACYKNMGNDNCCSFDSDSSSAGSFSTVHPPPQRRNVTSQIIHRPPTGNNTQYSNPRRDLYNDLHSNPNNNPAVTISFGDSSSASYAQSRTEPDNAVTERPPDYSTVTLGDLVNPAKPTFPVVKKDKETPPPEYGIENPLFK